MRSALGILLTVGLIVGACSSGTATPAPSTPATPASSAAPSAAATAAPAAPAVLTMTRIDNWVDGFHPGQRNSGNQNHVFSLIYNVLIKVDSDSKTLIPDLAETWEASDDARVYTFHLTKNAKWHDGTPFTADDVAFTLAWNAQNPAAYIATTRWMAIAGAADVKGTTNTPTGIEVLDPYTIRLTLAAPNAEFLRELANMEHAIVPKHILTGATAETIKTSEFATTKPIGTGPFKFVRFETAQYVEVEADRRLLQGCAEDRPGLLPVPRRGPGAGAARKRRTRSRLQDRPDRVRPSLVDPDPDGREVAVRGHVPVRPAHGHARGPDGQARSAGTDVRHRPARHRGGRLRR